LKLEYDIDVEKMRTTMNLNFIQQALNQMSPMKNKKKMHLLFSTWLCVLSVHAFANTSNDCVIVDDTAETLMQIRQGGFDLGEAEINEEELNTFQVYILRGMIEDIKKMPIYQLQPTRDKAFKDLTIKWNKICKEKGLSNKIQTNGIKFKS
jgi:hypothetical protein